MECSVASWAVAPTINSIMAVTINNTVSSTSTEVSSNRTGVRTRTVEVNRTMVAVVVMELPLNMDRAETTTRGIILDDRGHTHLCRDPRFQTYTRCGRYQAMYERCLGCSCLGSFPLCYSVKCSHSQRVRAIRGRTQSAFFPFDLVLFLSSTLSVPTPSIHSS